MISLSQETEALARRLADIQHISVEDTVRQALEDRARVAGIAPQVRKPRDTSPAAVAARRRQADEILNRIAAMPIIDPRSSRDMTNEINSLSSWSIAQLSSRSFSMSPKS